MATDVPEIEALPRSGSTADLARRVERLEGQVNSMQGTIALVEQNQRHAEELTKLRFDSLEQGVRGVGAKLDAFVQRFEGLMSGEIQTARTREAQEMVEDYQGWRKGVDTTLTQVRFLGRLTAFLIGGNALAIIVAIAAFIAK